MLRGSWTVVSLLVVAQSCNGQTNSDAGTDAEADVSLPADAGVEHEGAAPTDAGKSDGATPSDASDGAPDAYVNELPSVQTVTFRVSNPSNGERYLATQGALCTPFRVERKVGDSWQELPLQVTFEEPSDCFPQADYDGTGPTRLDRLDPGESYEFVWDARRYAFAAETFECGFGLHPYAAKQPAPPGLHRVTLGAFASPPANCKEEAGAWSCSVGFDFPKIWDPVCVAELMPSAEFALGASGNLVVDVALP